MEALQKTLTYRGDTSPCRKLHPDKDLCKPGTQQDDSNYVDLDNLLAMKSEGTKTVKVTFTGEGSQLAIFKCNNNVRALGDNEPADCDLNKHVAYMPTEDFQANNEEHARDIKPGKAVASNLSSETVSSSVSPNDSDDFRDCDDSVARKRNAIAKQKRHVVQQSYNPKNVAFKREELRYTDMYLNRKSESEDGVSVVLSHNCTPISTEDETHYITTHEIQLLELDHEVDYDTGRGSCWDIEDDNLVYSFVDYAYFDTDETIEEGQVLDDRSLAKVTSSRAQSNNNTVLGTTSRTAVSTKHEHDLCDLDKCTSSDESLSKNLCGSGNSVGQIHLSIKTSSRAINERRNVPEKEHIRYCPKNEGDFNGYTFKNPNAKAEGVCDRENCFIPAPRRLHIGSKLKGKDITEYSSGASSSISEMDDADKEVRNLTTRAFRSLACPYFDAINFSTSSESSTSEHGLGVNKWSAFVDLKYGNMTQGKEQSVISHKGSASVLETNKSTESKGSHTMALASLNGPQAKVLSLNGNLPDPHSVSSSTKQIELKGEFGQGQNGVITLRETLNFRCNVQSGSSGSERHAKFVENARSLFSDEVTGTVTCDPGSESSDTGDTVEDKHKKSMFASSLLKNVISKKMQFEHERKLEREVCDTCLSPSPCRDNESHIDSGNIQTQGSKCSEAGSGLSIVSLDELGDIVDSSSCELKNDKQNEGSSTPEPNSEPTNENPGDATKASSEAKSTLLRSQNSAFRSWRDDELVLQKEQENYKTQSRPESITDNLGEMNLDLKAGSNKLTKMSHLFLPNIQLSSKEELEKPTNKYLGRIMVDQGETEDCKQYSGNPGTARSSVTPKSPGIKINLRSVKENKHNQFNIANLLTPNIVSSTASTLRTADDSKCQTLVTSIKGEMMGKVPHFTVRDIRENKCKFQPPIYQVRDVRKLVKSSYHFVSLDNHDNKPSPGVDPHVEHKTSTPGAVKTLASVSPIVIKCQSVNTNSSVKAEENSTAMSRLCEDKPDIGASASHGIRKRTIQMYQARGRVQSVSTKQYRSDQCNVPVGFRKGERREKVNDCMERKAESKAANQEAIEKIKAAVRTMEQLYVFDQNEWRRKIDAPHPVTDSHILSLITSEEQEEAGRVGSKAEPVNAVSSTGSERLSRENSSQKASRSPPASSGVPGSEVSPKKEENGSLKTLHIPFSREENSSSKSVSQQIRDSSNKAALSLGSKTRASASHRVPASHAQPGAKSVASRPAEGLPLLHTPPRPQSVADDREVRVSEAGKKVSPQPNPPVLAEPETYLALPVEPHVRPGTLAASSSRELLATLSSTCTGTTLQDQSPAAQPSQTVTVETQSPDSPTATIYHHSLPMAVPSTQPQAFCFSPSVPPAVVAPSVDHLKQTQQKMLLDPTTGHYYLVNTPLQPAKRRLFDPETRQYVDVPVPQQSVTPVPLPVSPLALSPSAYGPTYLVYPGFVPSPAMFAAKTPPSQLSPEAEGGGDRSASQDTSHERQPGDTISWESPYYSPTGWCTQALPTPHFITTRGTQGSSDAKPVISITSQQGPRIIAPPSFDGTTMSFVVEHR